MTFVVTLDLRFEPARLDEARILIDRVLTDARAFDGCLGVGVLVDTDDPAHWVGYEKWESAEHDAAYRAYRARSDEGTGLGSLMTAAPVMTRFTVDDLT